MNWLRGLAWQQKLAAIGYAALLLTATVLALLFSPNLAERAPSGANVWPDCVVVGSEAVACTPRAANRISAGIQYAPARWCDLCQRELARECSYTLPGEASRACPDRER